MTAFGLAIENFTPESKVPSFDEIFDYAAMAESLGFDSLWAWDHLFLGARRPFPFLESLTVLTALAVKTERIALGTGVLVLPIRDPVLLAKSSAALQDLSGGRLFLGMAAGWYEREFEATGVPFKRRGQIFETNLSLLKRLWSEDDVTDADEVGDRRLTHVRMLPRPKVRPRVLVGGYVDRVLRRVGRMGDGWITYFYQASSFEHAWGKVLAFAEEEGRDPATVTNVAQLPLCIDRSYEVATKRAYDFVAEYFDCAEWSESTPESAIRGTPEQCAEQIAAHLAVGAQHLVFVPCNYEAEQVHRLASEVLPLLSARRAPAA